MVKREGRGWRGVGGGREGRSVGGMERVGREDGREGGER